MGEYGWGVGGMIEDFGGMMSNGAELIGDGLDSWCGMELACVAMASAVVVLTCVVME